MWFCYFTNIRLFLVVIGCKWVAWIHGYPWLKIPCIYSLWTPWSWIYRTSNILSFLSSLRLVAAWEWKKASFSNGFRQWVWVIIVFNTFPRLCFYLIIASSWLRTLLCHSGPLLPKSFYPSSPSRLVSTYFSHLLSHYSLFRPDDSHQTVEEWTLIC